MIDCYMSLTLPYAIELARKCEPYNVKWIEETLPPDDYDGYSELKKAVTTTLITTGEHEYTRKFKCQIIVILIMSSLSLPLSICDTQVTDLERFLRKNVRMFFNQM